MIYEFLYEDRVDNDIEVALDFYESINPALAEDFLNRIEEAKQNFERSKRFCRETF